MDGYIRRGMARLAEAFGECPDITDKKAAPSAVKTRSSSILGVQAAEQAQSQSCKAWSKEGIFHEKTPY